MSRPTGSKNIGRTVQYCAAGGAASAAKYRRNGGVEDRSGSRCYIPGEGWVRWSELSRSVSTAYESWRIKCSLAGRRVLDGWELRHADIEEKLNARTRGHG